MNNLEAVTDEEEQDNCSRWEEIINNQFASIGQKPFCANFKILQNLEKELKHGEFEKDFKRFLYTVLPTLTCGDVYFILNEYRRAEGTDIVHFGLRHLSEIQQKREPTWKEILLALCKIERLDCLRNLQPEIKEWVESLEKSGRALENQCCCKETEQQQFQNWCMFLPLYQYQYSSMSPWMMQPYNYYLPTASFSNSFPTYDSRNNFNTGNTNKVDDFNTGINRKNLEHRDKVHVFLTYSEDGNSIARELHDKLQRNDIRVFTEDYYFENDSELQLAERIPIVMKEVDYIVPILTEQYLKDIDKEANKNDDRSLNVRALYSYYLNDYINNGCRNSKIRPVCKQEYATVFVNKRKELTPCLSMPHKLWDGIGMFIGVLKKMPARSA